MAWIRRHALLTGATLALGGFLGLADGSIQHSWLGVDQATRGAVGLSRLPELDTPMRTLTLLGSRAGLISLIALAFVLLWGYRRRWALALPVIMAGTGGLQLVAKWAVNRPRPNLADWGYPSGHVLSLVVFFGLVAYLLRTSRVSRGWRRLGGGVGAGIVLTVAFSRLHLAGRGVSSPSRERPLCPARGRFAAGSRGSHPGLAPGLLHAETLGANQSG